MEIYFFILCGAAYLWAVFMNALTHAHIFQLNSYHPVRHLKWIGKNFGSVASNLYAVAFAAVAVYIGRISGSGFTVGNIIQLIFTGAFIMFALSDIPKKKAKKPLVYTARVKRLLITYMVLHLLILAAAVVLYVLETDGWYFAALFLGYMIAPLLLLLSNGINAPAEAAVRRHYVRDAKRILQECPDLKIIGITGSYGKTSMKYFLTTLLRQKYNVLMTPESYNTPMGVVKTVRGSLRGYHEIFVCEMGAKKVGEIRELCDIVSPELGMITSIGPQHLESFKSIENIINTKYELADAVGGKVFLNTDNEYIAARLPQSCVRYGTGENTDYRARVVSVSRKGTAFTVTYPSGDCHAFQTALIGAHNVVNLCGAVAMADFLGIPAADIQHGIKRIQPVPHRLQLLEKGPVTIIDDAFNSNPSGCKAALETMALFDEYKILITPGMVELGEQEDALNETFGQQAAGICDFVIAVGQRRAGPIMAGLTKAGYPTEKSYVAVDLADAMQKAYSIETTRKKVILLENDLPDNY